MTANPYESPESPVLMATLGHSRELVARLIAGDTVEEFRLNEATDIQLYGEKHREVLAQPFNNQAVELGFEPVVYQAILWFCLVYFPLIPRGTYLILPYADEDSPGGDDCERYRGIKVATDWHQVCCHYLIAYGLFLPAGGLVCWMFFSWLG